MGTNKQVNVSLHNDHHLRRLWTVGKDVEGLTSNVRDEDIIRHHVPESSGIDLGSRSSKEGLMVMVYRVLERAVTLVNVGVFVEHMYKLFFFFCFFK